MVSQKKGKLTKGFKVKVSPKHGKEEPIKIRGTLIMLRDLDSKDIHL